MFKETRLPSSAWLVEVSRAAQLRRMLSGHVVRVFEGYRQEFVGIVPCGILDSPWCRATAENARVHFLSQGAFVGYQKQTSHNPEVPTLYSACSIPVASRPNGDLDKAAYAHPKIKGAGWQALRQSYPETLNLNLKP